MWVLSYSAWDNTPQNDNPKYNDEPVVDKLICKIK